MMLLFVLWNILSTAVAGYIDGSPDTAMRYCSANSLCILIRLAIVHLLNVRVHTYFNFLALPVSTLIAYFVPPVFLDHFATWLGVIGMLYKMVEGTMFMNIAFASSRKLRDGIEEKFNMNAFLIVLISAVEMGLNIYLVLKIWDLYTQTLDLFLFYFLGIVLALQAFILVYTTCYGKIDCTLSNSAATCLYLTYIVYRYSVRFLDAECDIYNMNFIELFTRLAFSFGQEHNSLFGCMNFYILGYILIPLVLLFSVFYFRREYLMIYDHVQVQQQDEPIDDNSVLSHLYILLLMVVQTNFIMIHRDSYVLDLIGGVIGT